MKIQKLLSPEQPKIEQLAGVHDIGMRIYGDDEHPEDVLIDIYAGV